MIRVASFFDSQCINILGGCCSVKAELHYAIWFEPDSVMEFGRGPASSC